MCVLDRVSLCVRVWHLTWLWDYIYRLHPQRIVSSLWFTRLYILLQLFRQTITVIEGVVPFLSHRHQHWVLSAGKCILFLKYCVCEFDIPNGIMCVLYQTVVVNKTITPECFGNAMTSIVIINLTCFIIRC